MQLANAGNAQRRVAGGTFEASGVVQIGRTRGALAIDRLTKSEAICEELAWRGVVDSA